MVFITESLYLQKRFHRAFYADDRIITAGLRNGQHLCHIQANNSLHASKSTIYRHFHKGYYSASIVDLPRAVKFKPRRSSHSAYVPAGIKVGRSFDDFNAFMEEKHLEFCFEMDTVIGRPGGKVILTMIATNCNFMFGLLLDNKTAVEAASRFSDLKARLRSSGFSPADIMPVILTDNGCEFADVFSFENDDQKFALGNPFTWWRIPFSIRWTRIGKIIHLID